LLGTKKRLEGHQDMYYATVSFFSVGAGRIKTSSLIFKWLIFDGSTVSDFIYPAAFIMMSD